jgi:hypothetical protein
VWPLMRLVPGVRGDTSGDRRWPDPVWKSTATPPLPRPLPLAVSPVIVVGVMAQRQPKQPRFKSALPLRLAAVNLHAAGIDVGSEAHDERQRWCAKRSLAFLAGWKSLRRTGDPTTPPEGCAGAGGAHRTPRAKRTPGTTETAGASALPAT